MTTPCLLNNVETTLQTNLNTLNGKIKEIKGDLQQNLETCLQNISRPSAKQRNKRQILFGGYIKTYPMCDFASLQRSKQENF